MASIYSSEPNSVLKIVYVRKIGFLLIFVTSNNQQFATVILLYFFEILNIRGNIDLILFGQFACFGDPCFHTTLVKSIQFVINLFDNFCISLITLVSLYSLFLLKYSKLLVTIALYMQAKPFERTTKPMVAFLKEVELLITYSLF